MKFDQSVCDFANAMRVNIQGATTNIDAGESVALLVWWTFIRDHARVQNVDPNELAREQLESFLEHAAPVIGMRQNQ